MINSFTFPPQSLLLERANSSHLSSIFFLIFFHFMIQIYSIGLEKFKIINFSFFFKVNYIYSCEVRVFKFCRERIFEENNKDNKLFKKIIIHRTIYVKGKIQTLQLLLLFC